MLVNRVKLEYKGNPYVGETYVEIGDGTDCNICSRCKVRNTEICGNLEVLVRGTFTIFNCSMMSVREQYPIAEYRMYYSVRPDTTISKVLQPQSPDEIEIIKQLL